MTQQRQNPDPRAWDETKHQIGDSNIQPFGLDMHNPVFIISSVVIAALRWLFRIRNSKSGQ